MVLEHLPDIQSGKPVLRRISFIPVTVIAKETRGIDALPEIACTVLVNGADICGGQRIYFAFRGVMCEGEFLRDKARRRQE